MAESTAQRLSRFITHTGESKNSFANKIKTSSALISKLTTQDVDFRIDILQKIVAVYPGLNLQWLLTGVGEMLGGIPTVKPTDSQRKGEIYTDSLNGNEAQHATIRELKNAADIALYELEKEKKELLSIRDKILQINKLPIVLNSIISKQITLYDTTDIFYMSFKIAAGKLQMPSSSDIKKSLTENLSLYTPYEADIDSVLHAFDALLIKLTAVTSAK